VSSLHRTLLIGACLTLAVPCTSLRSAKAVEYCQREVKADMVCQTGNAEDFDTYFEFIDPQKYAELYHECLLLPWSEAEKESLRQVGSHIATALPGLARRASSGQRLKLYRTAVMPAGGRIHDSFDSAAMTFPDGIAVSYSFFNCSERGQMRELLHELVHAADFAGQIAYSEEWVAFANPTISHIRSKAALSRVTRHEVMLTAEEQNWPGLYATENLVEALAECFVAQACAEQNYQLSEDFNSRFAKQLLTAEPSEITFLRHYKAGRIHLEAKQYAAAISEFLQASEIDPQAATPHVMLSSAFLAAKQYEKAANEAKLASAKFAASQVPKGEPDRLFLSRIQSRCEYSMGNVKQAFVIADETTRFDSRKDLHSDSVACQFYADQAGMFFEAGRTLVTLAGYEHDDEQIRDIVRADAASSYVLQWLNQSIDKAADPQRLLQLRARFLEHVADHETPGQDTKKQLYAAALADWYTSTNKRLPVYELIACARLRFKMGELKDAQYLCNQALIANPSSLQVRTLLIGILEAQGQHEAARREYIQLHDDLIPAPATPAPDRTDPAVGDPVSA
jgi:tetratricopeptide (TPR) repeat protein